MSKSGALHKSQAWGEVGVEADRAWGLGGGFRSHQSET